MLRMITTTVATAAVSLAALAACDNDKTQRTEPNPGATQTPPAVATNNTTTGATVNATATAVTNPTPAEAPAVTTMDFAKAQNASDVKRLPDETKLAPTPAKLVSTSATVRKSPQGGESVTVVNNG